MLTYKDPGFRANHLRLTSEEYERAMQAFPILCADIVPVDFARRTIYLAERIIHPVKGWWWIGGRLFRGETPEEAAVRKLEEEAGIRIAPERLTFVALVRHMSEIREQEPREIGTDTLAFTYSAELTSDERNAVSARLDPKEFVPGSLRPFDSGAFNAVGVRPQVRDIAHRIFYDRDR